LGAPKDVPAVNRMHFGALGVGCQVNVQLELSAKSQKGKRPRKLSQ
jgi:hypothetical protein